MIMKINKLILSTLFVGGLAFGLASCDDDVEYSQTFLGEPYFFQDEVAYTTTQDVQINDSTTVKRDVELTRERPTLACRTNMGGIGKAYNYGFAWSTTNTEPNLYDDQVIYIDETFPEAVIYLQHKGIITDTTFVNVFPAGGPVYVRSFVVAYPTSEVTYSKTTVRQ